MKGALEIITLSGLSFSQHTFTEHLLRTNPEPGPNGHVQASFAAHAHHLGSLLKCRFWFKRPGVQALNFLEMPTLLPMNHTLSSKTIGALHGAKV